MKGQKETLSVVTRETQVPATGLCRRGWQPPRGPLQLVLVETRGPRSPGPARRAAGDGSGLQPPCGPSSSAPRWEPRRNEHTCTRGRTHGCSRERSSEQPRSETSQDAHDPGVTPQWNVVQPWKEHGRARTTPREVQEARHPATCCVTRVMKHPSQQVHRTASCSPRALGRTGWGRAERQGSPLG